MKASGTPPSLVARRLERGVQKLDTFAADAAQGVARHIASRGYANAPILTGTLRSKIWNTPVERQGDSFQSTVTILDGDGVDVYAPLMYASLLPHVIRPQITARLYFHGPISAVQPSTEEGGVGGLWFLRVANLHRDRYLKAILSGLDSLFSIGRFDPLNFS